MVGAVCCRIVEGKQRIESFDGLLGHVALHILRFVEDKDWAVGCNNINRLTGAELVALTVHDKALAVFPAGRVE